MERPQCQENECQDPVDSLGWCTRHYKYWYWRRLDRPAPKRILKPCVVEGCDRLEGQAKSLCVTHYGRLRKYGTFEIPVRPSLDDRFWAKVNKNGPVNKYRPDLGPCWIWTGARSQAGYGQLRVDNNARLGHRLSFELHGGVLIKGYHLDHLCRTRLCIRPSHLEQVTQRRNSLRSKRTLEPQIGGQFPNKSGYRGVIRDRRSKSWIARINLDGKQRHLGTSSDPRKSAQMYDEAARLLNGPEAITNFPQPGDANWMDVAD